VAAVDVGSVTTLLLIAASQDGGPFPVMVFHEGLEMEVVRWDLLLEPDGAHLLRTTEGPRFARFDPRGALLLLQEQRGSGGIETQGTNTLAKERPGLPFGPSKLQAIERARQAQAAADAAAGKRESEPVPPKSGGGKLARRRALPAISTPRCRSRARANSALCTSSICASIRRWCSRRWPA
jgi:hypothetical protein